MLLRSTKSFMSDAAEKYLSTLGLSREATSTDIKRAFKELAFQFHPDRNPHNTRAEERFKEVVAAYSYLSGNMEAYQALKQPAKPNSETVEQAQDIYKLLFDLDMAPVPTRHRSLQIELELSLEEAFRGGEKKIYLERHDLCSQCMGRGVDAGAKTFTCTYCFGEGEVDSLSAENSTRECPKCNGRGFISSKGCVACRAKGIKTVPVERKVSFPPGVKPNQILNIPHEGHEFAPGQRSDVHVILSLKKDARFTFDGKDIICEISVELADAALGSKVTVPSLAGPKEINLPHGIQSGEVIRLKGQGLGGDQFVRVWVKTPQVLSEKEKKFIQGFSGNAKKQRSLWWARIKKWIW